MSVDSIGWFDRWPHYCVTVVEGLDQPAVLAAIGAEVSPPPVEASAEPLSRRELRDERARRRGNPVQVPERPLVKVLRAGSTHVLFEPGSMEGTHRPVLRRLSAGGRALGFASSGTGMKILGYAEAGTVLTWVELLGLEDPAGEARAGVTVLGERFGIDVADVIAAEPTGRDLAFRLIAPGFGIQVSGRLLQGPAVEGRILPVLPELPSTAMLPLRDEADADFSALLRAAPLQRVVAAVSGVARHAAEMAGLADHPVVAEALRQGTPVTNESDLGRLLRVVIADGQINADPSVPEAERVVRRQAGHVLFTALAAAPQIAVALMIGTHSTVPVYRLVREHLADVEVPAAVRRAEHDKIRAQEPPVIELNIDLMRQRSGRGPGGPDEPGSRAVALGPLPPLNAVFDAPEDQANSDQ